MERYTKIFVSFPIPHKIHDPTVFIYGNTHEDMKRRTGGNTMHAWRPHHHPRATPPPPPKTKLSLSFAEFDREHLRIELLERSMLAAQAARQEQFALEATAQRTATQAHRAMEASKGKSKQLFTYNTPHRSKRKIRIMDHLSSEESKSIAKGLKEVKRLKVHREKIEQAEKATRHLIAVNKRKKEVERLLDQLTAASDPEELEENKKNAKSTRTNVEWNLNAVQASREQSDQALQTVIFSKEMLQNFTLEAPPDFSAMKSKIFNPEKVWKSVDAWQEKAMKTNQALLTFANNTKSMLEADIMTLEDQLEEETKIKAALVQKNKELEREINRLKRSVVELQAQCKKVQERLQQQTNRMKKMEAEFRIRTQALREELKTVQTELSNVAAKLHVVEIERDELKVEQQKLEKKIRTLEIETAELKQTLQETIRKCERLTKQIKIQKQEMIQLKEDFAIEKDRLNQSIQDLTLELDHAKKQVLVVEEKARKEKEDMILQHAMEMKELKDGYQKQKKIDDEKITELSTKLKASEDQIAADAQRLKDAATRQQELAKKAKEEETFRKELAESKKKSEAAAAEQASKLAAALRKVPLRTFGTQTGSDDQAEQLEKQGMILEDLLTERREHKTTRINAQEHLQIALEEQRKRLTERESCEIGIQTPIELLQAFQDDLDKEALERISETEALARKVLNKWLRKSIMKLFLPDDELKELIPKLDFEREGPGASLLQLLRQKGRRSVALSHVILRAGNRNSIRDRERRAMSCLVSNCQVSLMRDRLTTEMQRNQENVDIMKKYAQHAKNQILVHEDEKHELQLRVLREESLSSSSQAKTLKSVAELVRQVSKVVSVVRKNEQILRPLPVVDDRNEEEVKEGDVEKEDDEQDDNNEDNKQQQQVTVLSSASTYININTLTKTNETKNISKEKYLIESLGKTCARWMLLVENKLPQLQAASQRTRAEIGKLRRSRPLKESSDVKKIGYRDQIRRLKKETTVLKRI